MSAQNTFSPKRIANPPSTKLNTFALVANHNVNCPLTLPPRSSSGMMSIECDSTSPPIGPPPTCSDTSVILAPFRG